ncbi:MAG: thiol:disulfide interchange protein DsbA/DsbL [Pseudomonadota bacterium]
MRSLRFALAAAAMIATTAMATPADPKSGAEFTTLPVAQPAQVVGKKIEVIEFFAYHCPACYAMEPHVAEWVKKHKDDVVFKRIAFPFKGPTDAEARLFLSLDAMGKSEEWGPKVFRAAHVERIRLGTDEQILEWIGKSGMDKAKFMEYWNSFGVLTKLKRLPQLANGYGVNGTPFFVVDGRYSTSPSQVGEANRGLQNDLPAATKTTLDALVARAMKEKGFDAAAPAKAAPAKAAPAKTAVKK